MYIYLYDLYDLNDLYIYIYIYVLLTDLEVGVYIYLYIHIFTFIRFLYIAVYIFIDYGIFRPGDNVINPKLIPCCKDPLKITLRTSLKCIGRKFGGQQLRKLMNTLVIPLSYLVYPPRWDW